MKIERRYFYSEYGVSFLFASRCWYVFAYMCFLFLAEVDGSRKGVELGAGIFGCRFLEFCFFIYFMRFEELFFRFLCGYGFG